MKKLDLTLNDNKISAIISCVPGAIEDYLKKVKKTVENYCEQKVSGNNHHLPFLVESSENLAQTGNF